MADQLTFLFELDAKLDGAVGLLKALKETDAALKGVDAGLRKVEQVTATASVGQSKLAAAFSRVKDAGNFVRGLFEGALSEASKLMTERHRQHGNEVEKLDKTTKKAGFTFADVFKFEFMRRAASAVIDLTGDLIKEFIHLGESALEVAAQNERTGKSFELLFGATEGKDTLEWIEGIAKFTEFTDDELKGMAASLAKVGFAGEDLTRALAASLDMAAFSGSGAAGADAALGALERIKRTGKVDNRSLGGLGIGEPAFIAELSRRTGEGAAVIKKKIDEGKIKAEDSLEALYSMISRKTGKDLGGAGVMMSATLMARMKHLKDLPDQFFQKLSGGQGFAKISGFVGKLVEALDPDSAMGKKISGGLSAAFDKIGSVLEGIDVGGILNSVAGIIDTLPAKIELVTQAFKGIAPVIMWGVRQLTHMTEGLLYLLSLLPGNKKTSLADTEKNMTASTALKNEMAIYKTQNKFGVQDSGVIDAGHSAEMKRIQGMFTGPDAWAKAMSKLSGAAGAATGAAFGDGVEGGANDALEVQSPSRVFERIGMMTGAGFNRGIDRSAGEGEAVARGAFSAAGSGGGARGSQISVEINTTVNATGNGEHIAQDVSQQIREILPGALQSAIEQLAGQAGSA